MALYYKACILLVMSFAFHSGDGLRVHSFTPNGFAVYLADVPVSYYNKFLHLIYTEQGRYVSYYVL